MTLELKLIGKKGNGMVCLVEKDAPPIYQLTPDETDDGVFELDDDLVHSVVLDNLYTEGRKRRRLNLPYRRRGRNIEVLVREPYSVEGLNFHAVTFKGAGAKPYDKWYDKGKYVIDPLSWRGGGNIAQFKRLWGGLDEGFAVGEAENKILSDRNIFHTPYVAQNKIPKKVQDEIYFKANLMVWGSSLDGIIHRSEKQDSDPDLHQIVRLSMTNIRHNEFDSFSGNEVKEFAELSLKAGWTLKKLVEHLGKVDGELTRECLKLARSGKFLNFHLSDFHDNTYITGEITDLEQVEIKNYHSDSERYVWPIEAMYDSVKVLRRTAEALNKNVNSIVTSYFKKVSEISGYYFSENTVEYDGYRVSQLEKFRKRKQKVHA